MNSNSVQVIDQNKKAGEKENPRNYEVINFGRYMQDKYGKELSSLSWRVDHREAPWAVTFLGSTLRSNTLSPMGKGVLICPKYRTLLVVNSI